MPADVSAQYWPRMPNGGGWTRSQTAHRGVAKWSMGRPRSEGAGQSALAKCAVWRPKRIRPDQQKLPPSWAPEG